MKLDPRPTQVTSRLWFQVATLLFILASGTAHANDEKICRLVRLAQERVQSLGFDAALSSPEEGLLVVQFGNAKIYWACGFFPDSGGYRYETLLALPEGVDAGARIPTNEVFHRLEKSIRKAAKAGNIPLKRADDPFYGFQLIQRVEQVLDIPAASPE